MLATLAALAACAPLPRPFKGAADPLAAPRESVAVRIAPVAGAAEPVSRLLAEALARALADENVRAAVGGGGRAGYVVTGRAEPNRDDPALPYAMLIHWTLLDGERAAVGFQTQGVLGPLWQWDYGDPRLVSRVGRAAARIVAGLLRDAASDADDPRPAAPDLAIDRVVGAPGDGDRALAAALAAALRKAGMVLAEEIGAAPYRVLGTVRVTPGREHQRVRIVWEVFDRDGRPVGRAAQDSQVAPGSLDGAWGAVADTVARAAVPGIGQVMARHRFRTQGAPLPPAGRP